MWLINLAGRERSHMGGLFVGLLFVVGFFLASLPRPDRVSTPPAPNKDLQQIHLEQKIGECPLGAVAILDPRSGYLGCNFAILPSAK
jgi:hypothetical protein